MRANIQAANQARGGGNRLVPAEHSTWGGNAEDWRADVRTGRRRAEVAAATLAEVNVSSLAIEATSGFTVWIQMNIDALLDCFHVLFLKHFKQLAMLLALGGHCYGGHCYGNLTCQKIALQSCIFCKTIVRLKICSSPSRWQMLNPCQLSGYILQQPGCACV